MRRELLRRRYTEHEARTLDILEAPDTCDTVTDTWGGLSHASWEKRVKRTQNATSLLDIAADLGTSNARLENGGYLGGS